MQDVKKYQYCLIKIKKSLEPIGPFPEMLSLLRKSLVGYKWENLFKEEITKIILYHFTVCKAFS